MIVVRPCRSDRWPISGENTIWIKPVSAIAENATEGASPNCFTP